jgi:hypothetical protein
MLKFVPMKRIAILVLFLFVLVGDSYAQCAMCKSVVESNIDGGSAIGSGLNDGILYLMAMPYLALAIIAFTWLRYNKRIKA